MYFSDKQLKNKFLLVDIKESSKIFFKALTNDHIILRLFNNWLYEIKPLTDHECFKYLSSSPVGCSPIMCFSALNNCIKSSAYFFHWSIMIKVMTKYHINIVKLQFLQGIIYPFHDMLAVKSSSVNSEIWNFPEYFCGDNQISTWDIQCFDSISKLFFSLTKSIQLSCIKEVDSKGISLLDNVNSSLVVDSIM